MQSQRGGANTLTVDNPIRFGSSGNYVSFLPQGFGHEDSEGHTWNDGHVASLQFLTQGPVESGALRISVDPFVADAVTVQELSAYLNGLWVGFAHVQEAAILTFRIGPRYIVPGQNLLSFVMPKATSPREIGSGSDLRRLGFAFREIALMVKP